ncbi:type III pantothenate kinase [bacterium]|nr:type III pantothenate kinase [bacterium]
MVCWQELFELSTPMLAIDVGNSRTKYGWFVPSITADQRNWPECRHFATGQLSGPAPWDLIRRWTDPLQCEVAIAGSNPAAAEQLATHWLATTGRAPWVVRDRHCLPITVDVAHPETVGLDRLLNAVAVNVLRPTSQGAIVVDSGTATTVDVVTPDGRFLGGAILPGFALSSRALHHYTALLPELSVSELGPETPAAIGRETRSALRSGIFWGQIGAVQELIRQMCREQGWQLADGPPSAETTSCWLALTGGGGPWLAPHFPTMTQIPSLAMHGLVLTAWANACGQCNGAAR